MFPDVGGQASDTGLLQLMTKFTREAAAMSLSSSAVWHDEGRVLITAQFLSRVCSRSASEGVLTLGPARPHCRRTRSVEKLFGSKL